MSSKRRNWSLFTSFDMMRQLENGFAAATASRGPFDMMRQLEKGFAAATASHGPFDMMRQLEKGFAAATAFRGPFDMIRQLEKGFAAATASHGPFVMMRQLEEGFAAATMTRTLPWARALRTGENDFATRQFRVWIDQFFRARRTGTAVLGDLAGEDGLFLDLERWREVPDDRRVPLAHLYISLLLHLVFWLSLVSIAAAPSVFLKEEQEFDNGNSSNAKGAPRQRPWNIEQLVRPILERLDVSEDLAGTTTPLAQAAITKTASVYHRAKGKSAVIDQVYRGEVVLVFRVKGAWVNIGYADIVKGRPVVGWVRRRCVRLGITTATKSEEARRSPFALDLPK